MKNKKHKIFLYPLEENGKVRVFLFQSGDIGNKRDSNFSFENNGLEVRSVSQPSLVSDEFVVYVNGNARRKDFTCNSREMEKEEFKYFKELENAYNNREE